MTSILDRADQAIFDGERATGATSLIQCAWTYDRGIDLDSLRRFHGHLQRGRLARRVEPSPLPFGRHRWVSPTDTSRLEIAAPRPRARLESWLDEQANAPVDAERGPGWRLAVLPFTDGGAAVSLAATHCITDGLGLCRAIADAASGRDDAPALTPSRRRWGVMGEDARQTVRDLPAVARAVRAAARTGRPRGTASPSVPVPAVDEPAALPACTVFVDTGDWDACARRLGGSSNALLTGVAAELARRTGRTADRTVTVSIPVDDRGHDLPALDTRANAVTNIDVIVDSATVSTDLRPVRAAVKDALIARKEVADERSALLPLVPLLPRRVIRGILGVATGGPDVISSNLGDIDAAVNRPDGTDADTFSMRSLYPGVTTATMHRAGGVVALLSGRVGGHVFISTLAYLPGRPNSVAALRETLAETLAAFTLTGKTLSTTVLQART